LPFPVQAFDYALLAVAAVGVVWVLYGVLRRVLLFLLLMAALAALVGFAGYFQTGCFGKGFFAERSTCVGFVGTLVDAWAGLGTSE